MSIDIAVLIFVLLLAAVTSVVGIVAWLYVLSKGFVH